MTVPVDVLKTFFERSPLLMGVVELTNDDIYHVFDNPASVKFFHLTESQNSHRFASERGVEKRVIEEWQKHYNEARISETAKRFLYPHPAHGKTYLFPVTVTFLGTSKITGRDQYSYLVDIVDHNHPAESEADASFQILANSINHLAWMADKRGRVFWFNDRWYDYTGTNLQEMEGLGWLKVPHPAHLEEVKKVWEKTVSEGEPFDLTFPLRAKDGNYRWFLTRAAPIRNAAGEIVRWFGTNTDIQDQKELEDHLKQVEKRLSLAIDNAHIGFYDWDLVTDEIILSEKMRQDWGLASAPTVLGIEDIFHSIHPDDRKRVNQHIQEAIVERRAHAIEYRVVHFTGAIKWMEVNGIVSFDEEGKARKFFGTSVDITKRKTAEEALLQSERELRSFVEEMPQMAFVADAEGGIIFFNKRHYDYFGVQIGETEAWEWQHKQIHHPDDLERTVRTWEAAIRTGQRYEIEYRLRRFDGQFRWHLGRAFPIRNDRDQVIRWFGTNTDIHDQKQTELQLQESEAKFRVITNAMPQMIWSTLPDGYHDYFNERWYEYTGVECGSTDGYGWINVFHPDDEEGIRKVWNHSLKTGEPYQIEYRLRHRSGEYRWILGRALPIRDRAGNIIRWMGTCTDIHERRLHQAEIERLHAESERSRKELYEFFMQAPAPIVVLTGSEHRFALVNGPYENLVNRKVLGKTVREAFPDTEIEMFITLLDEVYRTGVPYYGRGIQFWRPNPDGTKSDKRLDLNYHPFRDNFGEVKGILVNVHDVTEEVKDKERIEALARNLQEALETRDQFLSLASHELKTPLTSLMLNAQVFKKLLSKSPDALTMNKTQSFVDQTLKQTDRLSRLVDDMLDISRIRTGRLFIETAEIELNDVLLDLKKRFDEAFRITTGCELSFEEAAPIQGFWDRMRIEQVVSNLLTNALRYGNKRPASMKLEKKDSHAIISVSDQGIGIAPENQKLIFERFERAGVKASEVSGLGLGLFITKQIVEAHGGHIWVQSSLGKGSTFYVELPFGQASQDKSVSIF